MTTNLRILRAINIGLALLGVLVFGALLVGFETGSEAFEQRAQGFITHQIDGEVRQDLALLAAIPLGTTGGTVAERIDRLRQELETGVPRFIAATIGATCRVNCADRAALEDAVNRIYAEALPSLQLGVDRLRGMVERKYLAVLAELRRDVAIFLTSNLIVIMAMLGLSLMKGQAARHLLPIAALLGVSTVLASYWYVFGQNWVWTIIFSDYLGWCYLLLLGAILALLADIALNRGRVTSEILNAAANLISLEPGFLPC